MCGIAGVFSLESADGTTSVVKGMLNNLAHRGADSSAVVRSGNCCLGHTRLSITGGSSGQQPFQADNIAVTFNGEIYNYLDLRTDLMRRGHRFKTKSDAEVIVHAYRAYGQVFVERLKGIFAFALYDAEQHALILCRDRVGVKPLYYMWVTGGNLFFASEIKAIGSAAQLGIQQQALCEYLNFQFCLEDRTLFAGVYKVCPGELLILKEPDPSKARRIKYWSISESLVRRDFEQYHTEKYYEDKLLSVLHKSVRQQTPTVPFGAYLSGGLDSGSVVSLMSEYADEFNLFTGLYESAGHDESKHAVALAKFLGREKSSHSFVITEDYVVDILGDAIYHMDEPCAGPGLVGQFALAKMLKDNFPDTKVVVGGQGGDELFGGYARYIVAYLESCIYGSMYPTEKDFVVQLKNIGPLMPVLQGYEPMLTSFFGAGMFSQKDTRYFDLVSRFNPGTLSEEFAQDVYQKFSEGIKQGFCNIFNEKGSVSYFTKMTYFDFKASLPALLHVDDRVNGAFAMEGRVPLLDEELVELAFSIPPSYKFSGGFSKGLLRKAVTGMLPESILWRRDKMGFPVPMQEWYARKGCFYELVQDYLSTNFCKRLFPNIDKTFTRSTWGKLSLSIWAKTFNMGL